MKKPYKIISFLLVLGYILCFTQLNAQNSGINASAPPVVTLGQVFNYTISGDFDGKVNLPEVKGLRIVGGPSTFTSQQSTIVNGRFQMVRQVSYTYAFIAEEEGDIIIPPVRITSGKKELLSNEVKIKVIKGVQQAQPGGTTTPNASEGKSESFFVQMIPSRKSIFLGEQIVLTSKIYTQEGLQIADIKAPTLEGFWKEDLAGDQTPVRETYNGQNYLALAFNRFLLTAQKPGEIRINPIAVNCQIQKKVKSGRSNSPFDDPFFNDPFFDRVQTVQQLISSNSLVINVKPLPANAPPGFSGAVGSFTIKASLDKDQAKVNDAISLKLTINGQGNLMLLKAIKVDFPPDLEIFDPKSTQNFKNSLEGTTGSVSFEYLIIPRHAGKFRISPIVFSYFDPANEKFHGLQTKEFNFSVEKSGDQDESFITSPGGVGLQGNIDANQGKNVVSLANDIQFIKLTPPDLIRIGKTLFGSKLFNFIIIITFLSFVGLIVVRKERIRRNADMNAVRNRKARKLAQKRLSKAFILMKTNDDGFYEEILKALWGYLSDKLGVNVSELSSELINQKLQALAIPESLLKDLWQVIHDSEFASYGTGFTGNKLEIYNSVIKLISDLQENIN